MFTFTIQIWAFFHMEIPEARNKMCVFVKANIWEPQMNYSTLNLHVLLNPVLSDGTETSEMVDTFLASRSNCILKDIFSHARWASRIWLKH